MRIFIADTFYDAIFELPKRIQKKVVEFQCKLRANSTTNGIHLEPIKQFRNSNLRTARVDDCYRAVVGVLNDAYHLLYVGNHEAAYDWGANKHFVWNEYSNSAQFIPVVSVSVATKKSETVSEKVSPSVFANLNDEMLLKLGVPSELTERVKAMVSLDDLDGLEKSLPEDAYENLFNVFDGVPIEDIISEIDAGQNPDNGDKLLSENNRRRFYELTEDEDFQKIIDDDMEKWQLFLHPSQSRLVSADYNGTMKVSGGAGTGKTIAALHRLKHLCEKENARVLFTTYTKTLCENLSGLVTKLGIPAHRFILKNIDQIVLDLSKEYKIKNDCSVLDYSGEEASLKLWREVLETEVSEFDEKFLYDEYVYVILYYGNKTAQEYMMQPRVGRTRAISRKQRLAVWKLVEKYVALKEKRKLVDRLELFNELTKYFSENNIHPWTNVIADEFQDFSNPELRFLRTLAAEGRNDLFLVGDPLQRIYSGRKINFSAAGINVRGKRSARLKVNYRTTEPIKRVAVSVMEGHEYDDLDGGKESIAGYVSLIKGGEKPTYEIVHNANEEIEKVMSYLNECKEAGIAYKDICVAALSNAEIKEFQKYFHKNDVSYYVVKGGAGNGDGKGVALCPFHSLKGLEFKVVILVGVNERTIPSKATATYPFDTFDAVEKKEYLAQRRSLLYVAITRARQRVFITGYGTLCELLRKILRAKDQRQPNQ